MDLKVKYKWDIFLPSLLGPGCSLVLRSPPSPAEPCAEPVDTCFLCVSFPGKSKGLNFPRNLITMLRACLTLHSVSNSAHLPWVSIAVAALPPREGFRAHSPSFPRESLTTSLKNYPQRRKSHFPFPQQPCQGFCLSALVLQASVLIPSVMVTANKHQLNVEFIHLTFRPDSRVVSLVLRWLFSRYKHTKTTRPSATTTGQGHRNKKQAGTAARPVHSFLLQQGRDGAGAFFDSSFCK